MQDNSLERRRRKRRVDGRGVLGLTRAIEAAEADEAKDRELLHLYNDLGYTYEKVGAHYGFSRQRATTLIRRAIMRSLMLEEYRAGRDKAEMARKYHELYPRRTGLRDKPKE